MLSQLGAAFSKHGKEGSLEQKSHATVNEHTLKKKVLQSTFFGASGCHK